MTTEWFIAKHEKRHGPFSSLALKRLAELGKLSAEDLVWKEGLKEWIQASRIAGLFSENLAESHDSLAFVPQREVQLQETFDSVLDEYLATNGREIIEVSSTIAVEGSFANEASEVRLANAGITGQFDRPAILQPKSEATEHNPNIKACPFCAETILAAAVKCKHCGEFLDGQEKHANTVVITPPRLGPSNGTAAVLSFLIPGLGQMYKGYVFQGFFIILLTLFGYLLFVVPGIIIHIAVVRDAFTCKPASSAEL